MTTEIIQKVIMSIINMTAIVSMWYRLGGKKIPYRNWKYYVVIMDLSIICTINYCLVNAFVKIVTITIIQMVFYRILMREDWKKSILTPIVTQLMYFIAETIYAIIVMNLLKLDSHTAVENYFATIITNVVITINFLIIGMNRRTKKIYEKLIKMTEKVKEKHMVMMSMLIVSVYNIFTTAIYYQIRAEYLILSSMSVTIICGIIVWNYVKSEDNYKEVKDKYHTTISSLKEYEEILNRYRVSNHENKNQILMIRNMTKNQKVIKYIDSIVENKIKDDEKLMFETSIIPRGGLRGLIYAKTLTMKEKGIEYELEIDRKMKTVELIEIGEKNILDTCKIVGVFLDNAIEEVEEHEKDKYIVIEMYKEENKMVIEITNPYKGEIEINRIEEEGYTTKTKGHGYGLTLVKEIIEKNERFENKKEITEEEFTQILEIRME